MNQGIGAVKVVSRDCALASDLVRAVKKTCLRKLFNFWELNFTPLNFTPRVNYLAAKQTLRGGARVALVEHRSILQKETKGHFRVHGKIS